MPRYIVHARLDRLYAWNAKAAGAEEGDVPPMLSFVPTDWMIEIGGLEDATITWGDERVVRPCRRVVAHRPMAIIAANETEAAAIATKCCEGWRDDVPDTRPGKGWASQEESITTGTIRRQAATPRHRRSFEVDYTKLVSPDMGPHHLTTDQMFELMRWIIRTSRNYEAPARWAPISVHRMLRGNDSNWDESVLSVGSRNELHDRLQRAVLGMGHDVYRMWREDHGIAYGSKGTIEAAHYGSSVHAFSSGHFGNALCDAVWWAMTELPGHTLSVSPNSVHPTATMVKSLRVVVHDDGFAFRLRYGFDMESHGSSWSHDIATTRGGEPFYETAERAMMLLGEMVPEYRKDRRMKEAA